MSSTNTPIGSGKKEVRVLERVSKVNDVVAADNRRDFRRHGLFVVNLLGSPGCGKTTLIEAMVRQLGSRMPMAVVEGDVAGDVDTRRFVEAGLPAIQINTGGGCHLDAGMIRDAAGTLRPQDNTVLFIENVGNLICTAGYDLGEELRVLALSTAEGDDKPLKYPGIFKRADILLITKADISEYVGFDEIALRERALAIQPELEIFAVSARTEEGMEAWCERFAELCGDDAVIS